MKNPRRFYREPNGDYLMAYPYVLSVVGRVPGLIDTRAAAIEHSPGSVQSTTATRGYLKRCRRVKWSQVPKAWRRAIVGPYTARQERRLSNA